MIKMIPQRLRWSSLRKISFLLYAVYYCIHRALKLVQIVGKLLLKIYDFFRWRPLIMTQFIIAGYSWLALFHFHFLHLTYFFYSIFHSSVLFNFLSIESLHIIIEIIDALLWISAVVCKIIWLYRKIARYSFG